MEIILPPQAAGRGTSASPPCPTGDEMRLLEIDGGNVVPIMDHFKGGGGGS